MLVGYARVSKKGDQDVGAQLKALTAAGVGRIYKEEASGGRWERPELHRAIDYLRKDDVLVVWKLDRLSRSLRDLLFIMEKVNAAGAGFMSLTEAVDTTTPAGRMFMQMLGSFAEFEREMLRERTRVGIDHARARGVMLGRPSKLTSDQKTAIVNMVFCGEQTAAEAARLFGVHPSTVSRMLSAEREKLRSCEAQKDSRIIHV